MRKSIPALNENHINIGSTIILLIAQICNLSRDSVILKQSVKNSEKKEVNPL